MRVRKRIPEYGLHLQTGQSQTGTGYHCTECPRESESGKDNGIHIHTTAAQVNKYQCNDSRQSDGYGQYLPH